MFMTATCFSMLASMMIMAATTVVFVAMGVRVTGFSMIMGMMVMTAASFVVMMIMVVFFDGIFFRRMIMRAFERMPLCALLCCFTYKIQRMALSTRA